MSRKNQLFGTLDYLAPEILLNFYDSTSKVEYGKQIDVWALGVLCHKMFSNRRLHPVLNEEENKIKDDNKRVKALRENMKAKKLFLDELIVKDEILNSILIKCLEFNYESRADIDEIFKILPKDQIQNKNPKNIVHEDQDLMNLGVGHNNHNNRLNEEETNKLWDALKGNASYQSLFLNTNEKFDKQAKETLAKQDFKYPRSTNENL